MSTANLILVLHAALGGWLGFLSPAGGLAVLVALVATTSGLYWHAGIGNLPTVEAYLLFLLLGALAGRGVRRPSNGELAQPDEQAYRVTRWVALVVLTLAASTAVALVRDATAGNPAEATAPGRVLADMLRWTPPGLARQLRALFVAAVGPALLLLGVHGLPGEAHRRSLLRGLLAGLALAVAAPVVLAIWFNPWGRPDTGQEIGVGVSGLFHDPHGFAAYLVLGVGVAVGLSRGSFRRGALKDAWAFLALASGACIVLLFTNSRTGLVAAVMTLVTVTALAPSTRGTGRLRRPGARTRFAIVAAVVLVAIALLTAWPMARGIAHEGFTQLASMRMWDPLRPEVDIWQLPSTRGRLALWRKSLTMMAQRPIWGAGPAGFPLAGVPLVDAAGPLSESVQTENAHNYFLQVGAEYGLPALAALLVLVGMVLAIVGRAARRCSDPSQRGLLAGICGGQVGFLVISLTAHPMLLAETQAVYWSVAALGVATAMAPSGGAGLPPQRSSRSRETSKPKYGAEGSISAAPWPRQMPPHTF